MRQTADGYLQSAFAYGAVRLTPVYLAVPYFVPGGGTESPGHELPDNGAQHRTEKPVFKQGIKAPGHG